MGAANMPPSSCFVLASLFHFVVSINFPGLRIPSNQPLESSYSIEPCTDVLQSGETRGNPVILNEGEGRRFLSPGYDGVSSYLPESKCLWTFAPAPGTSLRFTCSRFSYIPFSPRRSPASRGSQVNGLRFTHARRGDTVGQLAALIRVINKQNKGPN